MAYRILVDENTSPRVAESLRGKGHTAEHVHDVLDEGVDDESIVAFAEREEYVVLTHDSDFLNPEMKGRVVTLYYSDDTMDTYDIADRVDVLAEWVSDPADLSPVVNLSGWD